MNVTFTDYFQKSKVFLYPLLGLEKGLDYVPEQTYIAWEDVYEPNNLKFICLYKAKVNEKYIQFVKNNILKNELFDNTIKLNENEFLHVFDLSKHKDDFEFFLEGKYSKISNENKISIETFFASNLKMSSYIEGFLYPELYHKDYADELNVDIEIIKDVHELCSLPNLEKETLKKKIPEEMKLLKNNLIPLDKLLINQKP